MNVITILFSLILPLALAQATGPHQKSSAGAEKGERSEKAHLEKLRAEMNSMLSHLEREISDLESRVDKIADQSRTEWQNSIKKLSERRAQIAEDLAAAHDRAKEKGRDFWSRSKSALTELKNGVEKASRKLKKDTKS